MISFVAMEKGKTKMTNNTLAISRNNDGSYTVAVNGTTYRCETFDEVRELIETAWEASE